MKKKKPKESKGILIMKNGDLGIFCFDEGVLVLVGGIYDLVRF